MASLTFSPAAAAVLLLIFSIFISLSISISTHNDQKLISKGEHLNSPISESKSSPVKKPVYESVEIKNKTKSLKLKKTNSTVFAPITISIPIAKSKINKTLSSATKSKLNGTLIANISKSTLNKTAIASKSNTTKLLKPIKSLKSNTTTFSLKSNSTKPSNLTTKNQKIPSARYPPSAKPQSTPKSLKSKALLGKWLDNTDTNGEDEDIISEFRDLPSRLHSALVPDLHKLSTNSKLYLSKTHSDIAAGVKPLVGKKYAPSIASAASATLLVLPMFLVTALFRLLLRTGNCASLYRALLFVQAYLAIYFTTLSLTAIVTGLEPLRFFYAASPGAYAWTQAVQTLGYLVYLIAQLIVLVVAFSAGEGEGAAGKTVRLAQMLLGLAVGMHYYITVFHRAVTGVPPRSNWKVHGIYAAFFVVICGLGRADRRKKVYMHKDGDDGKNS